MKVILGIDPGIATTGFGVIKTDRDKIEHICHGIIQTNKNLSPEKRLLEIKKDLSCLIRKYKPHFCNLEKIFFQKNIKTAIQVAESRGVILVVLAQYKIPYQEVTPLQLKNSITGDGKANKKQVQKMVAKLLKLQKFPSPDDAADALALAIYPLPHN